MSNVEEKRVKKFLGFNSSVDPETGEVLIKDFCSYPQKSKKCKRLYQMLEKVFIGFEGIEFPVKVKHWVVEGMINDNNGIHPDFKGILQLIASQQIEDKSLPIFFKAEVVYNNRASLPTLKVHFYQLTKEGDIEIHSADELVEYTFIHYRNTDQFTDKRIQLLLKEGVNICELLTIPILPLQFIKFDDKGCMQAFTHLQRQQTIRYKIPCGTKTDKNSWGIQPYSDSGNNHK